MINDILTFFNRDDVPTEGAVISNAPMDIYEALQEVLKTALIHDGLCRGVKEVTKALDKYVNFNVSVIACVVVLIL